MPTKPSRATKSPLPSNWSHMLDEIQRTLAQAIGPAEARENALANQAAERAQASVDPLARWLEGLAQRVELAQQPLTELDKALEGEESFVRDHLAKIGDLRDRLTKWTAA